MRTTLAVMIAGALCLCLPAMAQRRTVRPRQTSPQDLQLGLVLRTRVSLKCDAPVTLHRIIEYLNEAIARKTHVRNALRLDPRVVERDPRRVKIAVENVRVEHVLLFLLADATTDDERQAHNELGYAPRSDAGVICITNRQNMPPSSRNRRDPSAQYAQGALSGRAMTTGVSGTTSDATGAASSLWGTAATTGAGTTGTRGGRARGMNQLTRLLVRLTGPENWGDVQYSQGTNGAANTSTVGDPQ